jgi:hypothetical protein
MTLASNSAVFWLALLIPLGLALVLTAFLLRFLFRKVAGLDVTFGRIAVVVAVIFALRIALAYLPAISGSRGVNVAIGLVLWVVSNAAIFSLLIRAKDGERLKFLPALKVAAILIVIFVTFLILLNVLQSSMAARASELWETQHVY